MVKTQVYFREEELEALHRTAKRTGKSVAELVREAVRRVWLRPEATGPVGLWDGPIGRSSADHDAIYGKRSPPRPKNSPGTCAGVCARGMGIKIRTQRLG